MQIGCCRLPPTLPSSRNLLCVFVFSVAGQRRNDTLTKRMVPLGDRMGLFQTAWPEIQPESGQKIRTREGRGEQHDGVLLNKINFLQGMRFTPLSGGTATKCHPAVSTASYFLFSPTPAPLLPPGGYLWLAQAAHSGSGESSGPAPPSCFQYWAFL